MPQTINTTKRICDPQALVDFHAVLHILRAKRVATGVQGRSGGHRVMIERRYPSASRRARFTLTGMRFRGISIFLSEAEFKGAKA